MTSFDSFKDPALCRVLLERLGTELKKPMRFMEVCGTHTVAIFQSGLHSLLPAELVHLTGPGCPVCVTHESEVAAYLELAGKDGVIVATFGDLMKVPGPGGANLKKAQAEGARVAVVYSPFDALTLAAQNPGDKVVFLGIGFETTAPAVAATVKVARESGQKNFYLLSFHKLVPPALAALLADPDMNIEAFLLPGHVSTIIGREPYEFIARDHHVPAVIAGFEPVDILSALLTMVEQHNKGEASVVNGYTRVAPDAGNPKARQIMRQVFDAAGALWRGIGEIPDSGLVLSKDYAAHDAFAAMGITLKPSKPLPGCRCGDVLKGKMKPNQCPLYGKACTPANPVGPCMVSTEGSCAAYYKYQI